MLPLLGLATCMRKWACRPALMVPSQNSLPRWTASKPLLDATTSPPACSAAVANQQPGVSAKDSTWSASQLTHSYCQPPQRGNSKEPQNLLDCCLQQREAYELPVYQTCTLPLSSPEAIYLPFGDHATVSTIFACFV